MYLATSQDMSLEYPTQNNSVARYTDLGDIWLYANTYDGSTWSRSVVNCSTGGSFVPRAACQIEALANLGEVSMVASTEIDSGGADWTRTIVHWKGHYFAVLDRMVARQDDDYTFACRWPCRKRRRWKMVCGPLPPPAETSCASKAPRTWSRLPRPGRATGQQAVDPPAAQERAPVQASGNDLPQPAVCFGAAEAG